MPTITAYSAVPEPVKGLVRDLRVRWALEEAGRPYSVRLLTLESAKEPAHRALQPFGQLPTYEDGELRLFESGAIVLHIGADCEALLPSEPAARALAVGWVFAALNSVEPSVINLAVIDFFAADEEWARLRRPAAEESVRFRLHDLAAWLGDKPFLEGAFTAGDLMMATVLRVLRQTSLVTGHPVLGPYLARCEARPAFQRALAAQLADFA